MIANQSLKTVAASSKETPCFLTLLPAFRESHRTLGSGSDCCGICYTPTGNGLGLDSSVFASVPPRQRSNRPCNRLISPVYQ